MLDIFSAATTTTFLYLPDLMKFEPTSSASMKPQHAAETSNTKAFFNPALYEIIDEQLGNTWSGVVVAHIRTSISSLLTPVFLTRSSTAAAPITDEPWFSPLSMRRSLIPTCDIIHSSLVSTILLSSSLVSL